MLRETLGKEILKLLGLAIAGYFIFVLGFSEAFRPQKVGFKLSVRPLERCFRVRIVNRLHKIENVSIEATFFTKVLPPKASANRGGRRCVVAGERTSYSPSTYVFDRIGGSPICLKPSDTIELEACIPDTTIDILRTKEPEICLSCNEFPSRCLSHQRSLPLQRARGIALFVALAGLLHYRSIWFVVNKYARGLSYLVRYRRRNKNGPQEAEALFAKELANGDLSARCFFYCCFEKFIRRRVKILRPYLDRKHEDTMFRAIVPAIIKRLPKYDYNHTTVKAEVRRITGNIIDETWDTKHSSC